MIDEATGICINCAKNEELKKYLQTCFLDNSECLICGEKESSIDIEEDKKFIALLKALIRLHYNELQYNHHWGGDKLYIILEKDNPILNHHYLSPENLDFLVGLIEEDSYSKPKYGIPLYMGFDSDNNRRFFGLTLQEEVSSIISEYENRLKIENQFKIEGEAFTLIKKFESDITNYLDIKKDLYRARIGYEKKIFNYDIEPISLISPEEGKFFVPFTDKKISSPPPPLAQPARLSRSGISYVYLASNKETAIAEIRPHPGHFISVGRFHMNKKLKFADFRKISIINFCESEEAMEYFIFLNDLGKRFSLPITPEERDNYLITQFITEVIRQVGFDGVLFRSSVGKGYNVVIFDLENVEYLKGTGEVFEVEGLKYKIKQQKEENFPDNVTHTVL